MSAESTTSLLTRIERLAASASDTSLRDALHRLKEAAQTPGRDVRRADLRTALSSSSCVPVVIALAQSAGWMKQVAKICGKAGVAGAVVDGGAGGFRAANLYRQGAIEPDIAVKHVGAEAGCGFVTSSAGTAGTLAVFMLTGSMGPMALAAGMGASMGSRYLYKQAIGDVLPSEAEIEARQQQAHRAADETDAEPQDIGPDAQAGAAVEDIGPSDGGPPPSSDDSEPLGDDGDNRADAADPGQDASNDNGDGLEGIGPGE
jgi:hypothetical protein